jgi:hypothetical protein
LKYKNGKDQLNKILNQATGQGNYHGKPLWKKLYAHVAALGPQNSFKNLEMILALNQAAFLVDSGIGMNSIDLEISDCQNCSLCLNTEGIWDAAIGSAFQAWEEIVEDNCKLFLLCDKRGKEDSKCTLHKILCWWSKLDKKIKKFNMESNNTDGMSMACAQAIEHALSQLSGGEENILALPFGQATDSGGGGIGNLFFMELTKMGLSGSAKSSLKSFCTLHCIQLTL